MKHLLLAVPLLVGCSITHNLTCWWDNVDTHNVEPAESGGCLRVTASEGFAVLLPGDEPCGDGGQSVILPPEGGTIEVWDRSGFLGDHAKVTIEEIECPEGGP